MPSSTGAGSVSASSARTVFIVSDLHLGGRYSSPEQKDDAGFRMMNHAPALAALISEWAQRDVVHQRCEVVINGDFVDFLAEDDPDTQNAAQAWPVFRGEPRAAVAALESIMARDAVVFTALAQLVGRGHTLTILLGNHDIELSLPEVRQALARRLAVFDDRSLRFIFDGEAYVVGEALIEHGNRYDRYNQVRHDDLRELRSLQSRRQSADWEHWFLAPAGSYFVVQVMNRLKRRYPFVDLLKPEREAVLPLLLALEPSSAQLLDHALWALLPGHTHYGVRRSNAALPLDRSTIAANDDQDETPNLYRILRPLFASSAQREQFLSYVVPPGESPSWAQEDAPSLHTIAAADESTLDFRQRWQRRAEKLLRSFDATLSQASLFYSMGSLKQRLPALLSALRVLQDDRSFETDCEKKEYLDAARRLASEGKFRYVLFGHTHLAKQNIPLGNDAYYFNSGTWCDLMRVPSDILTGSNTTALSALAEFVDSLTDSTSRGRKWVGYDLTYLAMTVTASGQVLPPQLLRFASAWPHAAAIASR